MRSWSGARCRGRVRLGILVAMVTAVVAGCSTQPTDLPLPGTRVSGDSYSLAVEFGSVLNLPARSKVLYNGSRIGVLREVSLGARGGRRVAIATVDITDDVRIPVGTTAELKQATVLGDFYIALGPPKASAPGDATMREGGVIPLANTTTSPQVEELLGGIAALANGGTLEKLQRTVENANDAFPEDTRERDRGIEVLRAVVARFAGEQPSLRQIIDAIATIAGTLDANAERLAFSIEVGPRRVTGATSAFLGLANVLKALGPNVVPIGNLIRPRQETLMTLVTVVNPLVATATRLDSTAPEDIARLDRILSNQIRPLLNNPSVDIVDVTTSDGRASGTRDDDRTDAVASVLRMIGAMR